MSVRQEVTSVITDATIHRVPTTAVALKVMTLTLMEDHALVSKPLLVDLDIDELH